MSGGARLALALAVLLALAGAAPAAGDPTPGPGERTTGVSVQSPEAGDRTPGTTAGGAATNGATTDGQSTDATTQDDQSTDEPVEITTEGFDPDYDPETVLARVERLRDLSADQDIALHQYDPPADETYDARDQFGGIRPAGAEALQLYSNASTERRVPLGYTVERRAAVHIYLLNDSALAAYDVSQEAVLAHEFVHALQFQNDLLSPSRAELRSQFPRWTTDSRLVTAALVEGDAMWVTEQYLRRYDGGDYSVAEYNRTLTRAAWPNSVAGTPYYYGYAFYERTGSAPDERTAAIRNPPDSTAALLHPTDGVERASLPDAPEIPESAELSRYHADTVGELVVRHALRMNGLSFGRAAAAADGWAGDRMYYYAAGGVAGPATHWVTVWESAAEAREFAEAWRAMLAANGARTEGDLLAVPTSDHAPRVRYAVERDGATVRITAAERTETVERLVEAAAPDAEPETDSRVESNRTGAVSSPPPRP